MVSMNENKPRIAVLFGCTASGKTALAVALSKYIDIEVISADSRQIFKYLDIGTAKPTIEEQQKLKHHLIDFIEPNEYYSAGIFASDSAETYKKIVASGKYPLVVGGAGLYIKSLIDGFTVKTHFDTNPETVMKIRENLEEVLEKYGKEFLYGELEKVDPEAAELYNDMNPRRILRALEYYYSTGDKFSDSLVEQKEKSFKPMYYGLFVNRDLLYQRINQRADKMWKEGLIDEVRMTLQKGFSKDLNSLNTVGYKETISFVEGLIKEKDAIELIKRNTRRYAKRQTTWFKSVLSAKWIKQEEVNLKSMADEIKRFYNF